MARPPQTPEYREAVRDLARGAGAAAAVGVFVNILHLSLPLYTIQVYDRVISSGSMDTLVALTGIVVVLLCFQAALDVLRHRIFTILGARMAAKLGRPVFEAAVESTLKDGVGAATNAMRDLGDLRTFVASGAIVLPARHCDDTALPRRPPAHAPGLRDHRHRRRRCLRHPRRSSPNSSPAAPPPALTSTRARSTARPPPPSATPRRSPRWACSPPSPPAGTSPRPAPSPASRPAAPPPAPSPRWPRPSASACRSPSSAPAPPSS